MGYGVNSYHDAFFPLFEKCPGFSAASFSLLRAGRNTFTKKRRTRSLKDATSFPHKEYPLFSTIPEELFQSPRFLPERSPKNASPCVGSTV